MVIIQVVNYLTLREDINKIIDKMSEQEVEEYPELEKLSILLNKIHDRESKKH